MDEGKRIDRGHSGTRGCLRVLGPMLIVAGGIFAAIGFVDFFRAFGGSEFPRLFWCAFVGLPMFGIGMGITKFAYMGKIGRYIAGEAAPVVKDTLNYMADGTQDGIRTVTRAIGEGLRDGLAVAQADRDVETVERVRCHKCNELNDADSRFCDQCGTALLKGVPCPGCGELNDGDAKFCDHCGRPMR